MPEQIGLYEDLSSPSNRLFEEQKGNDFSSMEAPLLSSSHDSQERSLHKESMLKLINELIKKNSGNYSEQNF